MNVSPPYFFPDRHRECVKAIREYNADVKFWGKVSPETKIILEYYTRELALIVEFQGKLESMEKA